MPTEKMLTMTITTGCVVTILEVDPTYEWMNATVGGYIEAIRLRDPHDVTMWVNEEYKLVGAEHNECASRLAHSHGAIFSDDWVGGDVLLLGPVDRAGDETALPVEFIEPALRAMQVPVPREQRTAPTFWQSVAEQVYAGVPVIVGSSPDDYPRPVGA